MHFLHVLLLSLAAVSQTLLTTARATRTDPVLVRAVFDGDTIDVATIGRVRLLGIDAPEIGRGFDTAARRSTSTIATSHMCSPRTAAS
jgi:endonuclease YncB( thermonuclease family)